MQESFVTLLVTAALAIVQLVRAWMNEPALRRRVALNDEYDGHGDYLKRTGQTNVTARSRLDLVLILIFAALGAFHVGYWSVPRGGGDEIGIALAVPAFILWIGVLSYGLNSDFQRGYVYLALALLLGPGYMAPEMHAKSRAEEIRQLQESMQLPVMIRAEDRNEFVRKIRSLGAHGRDGKTPPGLQVRELGSSLYVQLEHDDRDADEYVNCVRVFKGTCPYEVVATGESCAPMYSSQAHEYKLVEGASCDSDGALKFIVGGPRIHNIAWLSDSLLEAVEKHR